MPTLNAFDRGDGRETTIIFQDSRRDGIKIQKDVMNTLEAHMGTGGNNVPMLAFPIQGTSIGQSNNAGPQGKGFGDADDPMFTLDSGAGANAVATIFSHTQGLDAQPSQTLLPTLRAGGAGMAVQGNYYLRRLTPVECERLQGFTDGWTECVSDSQRYKQMGNAVTVNVVAWIGAKL